MKKWLVISLSCLVVCGCRNDLSKPSQVTTPAEALPETIPESAVKQFRQFCFEHKFNEYSKVHAQAKRLFVVGGIVEGYPDVLPSGNAYHRIADQLKREGKDQEGLRAITLFGGGDGIVSHDIVLVVVDKTGEVIGVYHVRWGR